LSKPTKNALCNPATSDRSFIRAACEGPREARTERAARTLLIFLVCASPPAGHPTSHFEIRFNAEENVPAERHRQYRVPGTPLRGPSRPGADHQLPHHHLLRVSRANQIWNGSQTAGSEVHALQLDPWQHLLQHSANARRSHRVQYESINGARVEDLRGHIHSTNLKSPKGKCTPYSLPHFALHGGKSCGTP
jgi:hypothetical protein